MRIANLISDSIVDGPGLRLTVFTQGCPHRCPGCQNPETHDPSGGREVSVAELAAELDKNPLLQGLTLSGGDPFFQAEECAALAREAKARGLDVWTYTGYTYEALQRTGRTFARCSPLPMCWWTGRSSWRESPTRLSSGAVTTSASSTWAAPGRPAG